MSEKSVSAPTTIGKRVGDLVLEIAVAVTLVGGGIVYVASHPKGSINWGRIALAGNTVIVFGLLISWFREAWKRLVFWTALVFLLLCHAASYVFVLNRIPDLPLAYYVVLNSVELAFFTIILRKLLAKDTADR